MQRTLIGHALPFTFLHPPSHVGVNRHDVAPMEPVARVISGAGIHHLEDDRALGLAIIALDGPFPDHAWSEAVALSPKLASGTRKEFTPVDVCQFPCQYQLYPF